jgi:hypothetical protein
MPDLSTDFPDIRVIIDKDEPFRVNLLQGESFSVNVTHDAYNVTVEDGEQYVVSLQPSQNYLVNVVNDSYNIILDKPSTYVIPEGGLYSSTAEYASAAGSASYANRSSYADYAPIPDGFITASSQIIDSISGNTIQPTSIETNDFRLNAGGVQMVFTGSVSTGIFGVSEYVRPFISTTEYSGASIEYMATRPGASRMGIIIATWSGSLLSFTDVSTADVGDTRDISFGFLQFGNELRLRVNSDGSGSGTWTVQSLFKLFPNIQS